MQWPHQVNLMRSVVTSTAIALASAGVFLAGACSKTTTSLTAPTSDKCQVGVSSVPSAFTANGGQGSLSIATSRDCTWSIATEANWVSITGERSGQGEASIPYTVAPNPVPTARTGAIAVGSQTVAVTQAPAPCVFSLSRAGDAVSADGGTLSVTVTTLTGCSWTATSPVDWIVVASGRSGNTTGTVGLTIAANAGAARVAAVTAGGHNYTVTQAARAAAPPEPAPSPGPAPAPTPTPGPTPPPTPTPTPQPRVVDFEGTIRNVSGRCPALTFTIGDLTIVTDRATDYNKIKCGDLRPGRSVSGQGTTQANGTIKATDIQR